MLAYTLTAFGVTRDGKYDPAVDCKYATVPCLGPVKANFVADWVDPYDCVLGSDTAKIIYREFEAFGKDGKRGSAFDTIYVWRLPQLTPNNIYCAERDTVYCGVGDSPGPFMVVDSINPWTGMATGFCDTLPFLNITSVDGVLECTPASFDPKCGIAVHVDKWKFEDHCSPQYKVTVEVKQTCWGAPDICAVTPAGRRPWNTKCLYRDTSWFWILDLYLLDYRLRHRATIGRSEI